MTLYKTKEHHKPLVYIAKYQLHIVNNRKNTI